MYTAENGNTAAGYANSSLRRAQPESADIIIAGHVRNTPGEVHL